MKKNVGLTDQLVRFAAAAIIVVLYFTGQLSGFSTIILLVLAAVLILTGLFGFCPLYYLVGISTCKVKNKVK